MVVDVAGDQVASMEGDVRRDEETSGTRSGYEKEVDLRDGYRLSTSKLRVKRRSSNIA